MPRQEVIQIFERVTEGGSIMATEPSHNRFVFDVGEFAENYLILGFPQQGEVRLIACRHSTAPDTRVGRRRFLEAVLSRQELFETIDEFKRGADRTYEELCKQGRAVGDL
jgi:hypothetical protein